MRRFIYQSITDRLSELKDSDGNPTIKHFDIWNNNLAYIEDEQPFYTPAVFVEFRDIQWQHQGNAVRDAAVTVVLHVITQKNAPTSRELPYAAQALQYFDLLTQINVCLHGYANHSHSFGHDAITAVQSSTDHDAEELLDNIEVFALHATDASAMPKPQTIEKPSLKIRI